MPPTDRRSFLHDAALVAACAAMPKALAHAATTQVGSTQDPDKTGIPGTATVPAQLPTLRQAGAQRGLLVGTAVAVGPLRRDPLYAALIKQQANIIVAENAMKFGPLRPAQNRFFFDDADFLFAFAAAGGIKVRGHNFVWHRQLPSWFAGYADKNNAASILTNHIETVGGRYAGRVHSWDVVNEAIHLEDNQPGGLRNSPWYALLGPEYIDLAYRTARRVDPTALLCYNDYGIESEAPDEAAKRDAVLKLLHGMQKRGVPLDAVGIQSHIAGGGDHHYGPGLQQFMSEVQSMGLAVLLTEMDVNDRALPPDLKTRDEMVASTYFNYLNLTLAHQNTAALLTWGITDKYTWLNEEDARPDKLPERALPFDADLRPTLAYVGELKAVEDAPARSGRLTRFP